MTDLSLNIPSEEEEEETNYFDFSEVTTEEETPTSRVTTEPKVTTQVFDFDGAEYQESVSQPVETEGSVQVFDFDGYTPEGFGPQVYLAPEVDQQRESEGPSLFDVRSYVSELGRSQSLTKEEVLADPALMEVVYKSLETRWGGGGLPSNVYRGITAAAGGAAGGGIGKNYRDMDPEEAFEIWQNWQRSFAGGQTVTTANEFTFGLSADDEAKAYLGMGYSLFDEMGNAFTGEGSWSETFDAVWDYGKSVVYDPTTLFSFGVGKALGAGGTKATGLATRTMMQTAYRNLLRTGMSQGAARAGAVGLTTAAHYGVIDGLLEGGKDVAYQSQLIRTGSQDEYRASQTALVAFGSVFLPVVAQGSGALSRSIRSSDALKDTFLYYNRLDDQLGKASNSTMMSFFKSQANMSTYNPTASNVFGNITTDTGGFRTWATITSDAAQQSTPSYDTFTDTQLVNEFFDRFWKGTPNPNGNQTDGYVHFLAANGFRPTQKMIDEMKVTGIMSETIRWLDDGVAQKIVSDFEAATGRSLSIGVDSATGKVTSDALADTFASSVQVGAGIMEDASFYSRILNAGGTSDTNAVVRLSTGWYRDARDLTDQPKRMAFALSTYKRLLTSHLSTTGANVRGFSQLVSIDSLSDFALGAINLAQAGLNRSDVEKYTLYMNRAKGAFRNPFLTLANAFNPEIPMAYAQKMFDLDERSFSSLMRDIAGDGGVRDSMALFNMDDAGVLWKGVDAFTKGAQTLSGVRVQDDLTKRWAFGSNLQRNIMRQYGMNVDEFMNQPDVAKIMTSDDFLNNVINKSLYSTLRQTASVNWSSLPATTFMRQAAKGVERVTNRTAIGFVVPFGSFMNTTIATVGDYTGFNFARSIASKRSGRNIDFATEDTAELLAKAITGYAIVGAMVPTAWDKIREGYSWNQDPDGNFITDKLGMVEGDGDVGDVTFDWPGSTLSLLAQIVGHATIGGGFDLNEVPDDLMTELGLQVGGQAIRDTTDILDEFKLVGKEFFDDPTGSSGQFLGLLASKFGSGLTRPFDPANQVAGFINGNYRPKDLRQGSEYANRTFRYVNELLPDDFLKVFGATPPSELPDRYSPTMVEPPVADIGKQLLGTRSSPSPTLYDRMLNSAGMRAWSTIRFEGPPEVRNELDRIIAPLLQAEAADLLSKNPEFFEDSFPLEKKVKIVESVMANVKPLAISRFESGFVPEEYTLLRDISNTGTKDQLTKVLDYFNVDDLEGLLQEEDGLQTLRIIKYYVKNYDRIFHGDLKLD